MYCYICKKRAQSPIYHVFPKKTDLRKLWLKAFAFKENDIFKSTKICANHFEKDCYVTKFDGKLLLKKGSVPTLNLGKRRLRRDERLAKESASFSKEETKPNNETGLRIENVVAYNIKKPLILKQHSLIAKVLHSTAPIKELAQRINKECELKVHTSSTISSQIDFEHSSISKVSANELPEVIEKECESDVPIVISSTIPNPKILKRPATTLASKLPEKRKTGVPIVISKSIPKPNILEQPRPITYVLVDQSPAECQLDNSTVIAATSLNPKVLKEHVPISNVYVPEVIEVENESQLEDPLQLTPIIVDDQTMRLKSCIREDFSTPERGKQHFENAMRKVNFLRTKNKFLQKRNARYAKKIDELKLVIKDLKKNQEDAKAREAANEVPSLLQIIMDREKKSKTAQYDPKIITFAINLSFYSPKGYEYVRKSFDNLLPSLKTLQRS